MDLLSEPDRPEKVNDKKVMKYQSITAGMVIPILKHIYRPSNCYSVMLIRVKRVVKVACRNNVCGLYLLGLFAVLCKRGIVK